MPLTEPLTDPASLCRCHFTPLQSCSQDDEFELWLIVAASFKIVQAVYTVYQQSSIDIFFVDWEDETHGGGAVGRATSAAGASGGVGGACGGKQPSVWRTLFVANEFHELGAIRKVPYQFLVLSVLFFWYVMSCEQRFFCYLFFVCVVEHLFERHNLTDYLAA